MTEPGDLMQQVARLGAAIDPALTDRDVARLVDGARHRRRRRAMARLGLAAAGLGVVSAFLLVRPGREARWTVPAPVAVPTGTVGAPPSSESSPQRVRFADGSVATPLDEGSAVVVEEVSAERLAVDLVRGRERFEVVPRPQRSFVVHAGDVTITVLGTVFTVERVADRIGVGVERGRVLVDWGVGSRALVAGDSGWFPPLLVTERVEPSAARPPRQHPRAVAASAPRSPGTSGPAVETAEGLLAAADTARLSGRAGEGAALLRRVLQDHRGDPRAPLAAFTLGRVLLMEVGRPREAAEAFAEVRTLAPHGPFAEDALAREAQAWAEAGETGKARLVARDYLRLYPRGRRADAVKALGGAE